MNHRDRRSDGARRGHPRVSSLLVPLAIAASSLLILAGCGDSAPARSAAATAVPLRVGVRPTGGVVVLAPVFINGKGPFRFIVDTGASKSVIDQALAKKLGFTIHPSHSTLTGVNASHAAGRIVVSDWRIGQARLPSGSVLTLPLAADQRGSGLGGLIGSDNLSAFGSFLLNYRAGRLILGAR